MNPLSEWPEADRAGIRYALFDIDDTLTTEGRLTAGAYSAMERLKAAGLKTVPVTGRPAGWCDHIARMWPVDGVVGENGALYFYYDAAAKKMVRRYWKTPEEREWDRRALDKIGGEILKAAPGAAVAADQAYREADLAVDFCEDIAPLPAEEIKNIVKVFERSGATAKVSSIHVNGWFGSYDKLSMTKLFFSEVFGRELDAQKSAVAFAGDSPNDAPMFRYFPNSVGMANIEEFKDMPESDLPAWKASKRCGEGFVEMAECLLSTRNR